MNLRDWFLGLPEFGVAPLVALLLGAPLFGLLLFRLERARARRLARLVGPRVRGLADLRRSRRRLRRRLVVGALLLALVALLQPAWGRAESGRTAGGVDVLIALDVSRSMLAGDLPPSRLERAKRAIGELAAYFQDEGRDAGAGDRLGLVAFAGEARLIVPLTHDLESFQELLERVDPLSVPRGGSDLGGALAGALAALPSDGAEQSARPVSGAIVLLTDGEELEGPVGRGRQVAQQCQERGIAVHCIGFGSSRGSKIAVDEGNGAAFLRDRAGREVVSALDAANLQAIAAATGGEFVDAGDSSRPLVELYERRLLPQARRATTDADRRERPNRYQWPLLAAFLLLALELGLHERSRA